MAYGDKANSVGSNYNSGGGGGGPGFGAATSRAVSREQRGPQIGNWFGAQVYKPTMANPGRSQMTNFQSMNLNQANKMGAGWESRPGTTLNSIWSQMGGMGGRGWRGPSLPNPGGWVDPVIQQPIPPMMPPPAVPQRFPGFIGPPQLAPETVAPMAPETQGWQVPGGPYTNPPVFNPAGYTPGRSGVQWGKSNYGGNNIGTTINKNGNWGLR